MIAFHSLDNKARRPARRQERADYMVLTERFSYVQACERLPEYDVFMCGQDT